MAQVSVELTANCRPIPKRMHLMHSDVAELAGTSLDRVDQFNRFAVGDRENHIGAFG